MSTDCPADIPRTGGFPYPLFWIGLHGFLKSTFFKTPHFFKKKRVQEAIFSDFLRTLYRTVHGLSAGFSTDSPQDKIIMRGLWDAHAGCPQIFRGFSCALSAISGAECPRIFHGQSAGHGRNKRAAAHSYRPWGKANLRPTHTKSVRK